MERKKTSLLIIGVCALVLSVIGITYAFWQLRLSQTDENNLTSSCFDVTLEDEQNEIFLEKASPVSDREGEELTPFTFKIKNNCDASVKYQINLESLNTSKGVSIEEQRLASKYIKEKLNEVGKEGPIRILTDNTSVEKTIEEAAESYKLTTGYMEAGEAEKTFELRLWLDGDLTMADEEAMNKTFASKITVTATYAKEAKKTLVDTILAIEPETENSGTDGLYKVEHTGAEMTYTEDENIIKNLQKAEYRYAGSDPNNYVSFGEKYENDKYELIVCEVGHCLNATLIPSLDIPESFSSKSECDSKQEEIKRMLGSESAGEEIELNCQQTQKKGELISDWRIIGLVNTPEGQRVKLIKDQSIGNYSWDTSSRDINNGFGVNEWSQSDLMKLLNPGYLSNELEDENGDVQTGKFVNNSLYWNGENGQCYASENNTVTECDFKNTKIPDTLKKIIETVTWNTGSNGLTYDWSEIKVNEFYNLERSSNYGKTCDSKYSHCNDEVGRKTSWEGKVGLMYLSDYGYATTGGSQNDRTSCLEKVIYQWGYNDCQNNDWLLPSIADWTLSPVGDSEAYDVFFVGNNLANENVSIVTSASGAFGVRPSIYLKPDVLVSSGNGSKDSPYILEY